MKRLLCLVLAVVLLSSCGGSATSKSMTLEEFIEKYKRAEWSTFTSVVGEMMDEFTAIFSRGENWSTSKDAYNPEKQTNGWIFYEADIILFNKPFEVSIVEHNSTDASGSLKYECSGEDCFVLGLEVFENIAKRKGDAKTIELDDTTVTEAELRKAVSAGIDEGNYKICWGSIEENNAFTISCYRYYKQPGWITLY